MPRIKFKLKFGFIKLIYLLLVLWLFVFVFNYLLNSFAKLKYYVRSDAEFVRYLNAYEKPSLSVLNTLNQFVLVNNIRKPLFSTKYNHHVDSHNSPTSPNIDINNQTVSVWAFLFIFLYESFLMRVYGAIPLRMRLVKIIFFFLSI